MLRFDRKQQNSVKQLSFNKKQTNKQKEVNMSGLKRHRSQVKGGY